MKKWIWLMSCVLVSCNATGERHPETVAALVESGSVKQTPQLDLATETIATTLPSQDAPYRIGVYDVIDVQIDGMPQFSVAARRLQSKLQGFRVQYDGNVYLPLVGGILAKGQTTLDLRENITKKIKVFNSDPNVAVDILSFDSQKFYVLGQVNTPGVFPVDGRRTLLEGISLAGGTRADGDLHRAFVIRRDSLLPVSLSDLILRGNVSRNIRMEHGDLVYIPTSERRQVYVLGDVMKPGVIVMPQSGLSLVAAIAAAGGLDLVNADINKIRVFRGSWQSPQVYTLSTEDLYEAGSQIELLPGDCIHIAPRALATWDRTRRLLAPMLTDSIVSAAALTR